jgi:hypothetical protein
MFRDVVSLREALFQIPHAKGAYAPSKPMQSANSAR